MVEGSFSTTKVGLLIAVIWVLSLTTTLTAIYVVLNFAPSGVGDLSITTDKIVDGAIITTKLADGSVISAKILDGTITGVDISDGSIIAVKIADGAVTTEKISDDAITSLKLAANAIPFMFANGSEMITKTTATYENITDLSVTMTVERKCTLLIVLSVQCAISDLDYSVIWRVFVNTDQAGSLWLQPPGNASKWSSVSHTFCQPNVNPGEYTVYAQWYVSGGTAWTASRVLYVIALPTG
ncbi:MAG: hypothetical protein OEY40_05610 [Candidatus Bathyarchaeota archaeon]|nr:hypothetical protein [Candidatus Bathyarchaeota archaeon]